MHLYYLKTTEAEDVDYDQMMDGVIAADSAVEARSIMAANGSSCDPGDRWTDSTRSTCEFIGTAAPTVARGSVLVRHL